MRGKFITFEGPEGSGKSTQSRLLCEWLKKKNVSFVHTREPGGTKIGEELRQVLLDTKNKAMSVVCEMFVYQACRAQIMDEVILPALKKGKLVICDRFLDATIAYQGYGSGLSVELIKKTGKVATRNTTPELTILLDIESKEGLRRAKSKDRMERKPLSYHKRVRKGYLLLAKKEPKRIKVIKVHDDINKTQEMVRQKVQKCLGIK